MRRAQEALNQAELVHVAAAAPRKEMERIEERFQHREYARVIERAGTLERELNQLSYQHVSKTLSAFQAMLGRSREEGKDTTTADDLLKQSRRALEEGRPLEALQLATRSESELERVDLQMRLAKAAMDTLETKYSRTTAEGIRAPIAGAEDLQSEDRRSTNGTSWACSSSCSRPPTAWPTAGTAIDGPGTSSTRRRSSSRRPCGSGPTSTPWRP